MAAPSPLSAAPTGLGNTEMQDRMVSSTCEETVKKKPLMSPSSVKMPSVVNTLNSSSSSTPNVRLLTLQDVSKAALTLCEAFQNDTLSIYLTKHISSQEERTHINKVMYECYLRQHIDKGLCVGVGETQTGFETVAVWSAPKSYDIGLETFQDYMEAGFDRYWHLIGPEGRDKVFKGLLPLLDTVSHRILTTDPRFHDKGLYTLVYLGSLECARGKGNVRAMFDFMFENYIDVPGTNNIAYLESSAPSNIGIYNRFGFHAYEKIVLGDNKRPDAKEGVDYALMNVMIRDCRGADWREKVAV